MFLYNHDCNDKRIQSEICLLVKSVMCTFVELNIVVQFCKKQNLESTRKFVSFFHKSCANN